jgi:tetratricopeptide (TPR) repeat protein
MDPESGARAQQEFERAERELERNNVLAALACLERALDIWNDPHWHSRLGFCIAKERGHFTRGLELCRGAIKHEPDNPQHYLYLGKLYRISGNTLEALQAFRHGMTLGAGSEIERELAAIGTRKRPPIPFLHRNNLLNKYFGKFLARLGLR